MTNEIACPNVEPTQEGHSLKVQGAVEISSKRSTTGFCIIGFIDGPKAPMSDYVHIGSISGYERQTEIREIVGKGLRD